MSELRQNKSAACGQPTSNGELAAENSDLLNRARRAVAQQGQLRNRVKSFEYLLDAEVLVVRGCVPTYYLKQMVQTALKDLEGVRRIDNQVEVIAGNQ